jgi:predicted transcriptional regulator
MLTATEGIIADTRAGDILVAVSWLRAEAWIILKLDKQETKRSEERPVCAWKLPVRIRPPSEIKGACLKRQLLAHFRALG